jgi:hypothetical protein
MRRWSVSSQAERVAEVGMEEELVSRFIAAGYTRIDAEFHAKIAMKMGRGAVTIFSAPASPAANAKTREARSE